MILVAHPDRPFDYTPKATLRRAAILTAYHKMIDNAYKAVDDISVEGNGIPIGRTHDKITRFIRNLFRKVVDNKIQDTENLYDFGGDRYVVP